MAELSIRSERFGGVTVEEDSILDFPEGLVGIPDLHRFALLDPVGDESPFRWLLSLDDPEIAYAVADPSKLFSDYEVSLNGELEVLGIEDEKDTTLFVILDTGEDPIRTTANLLAPIIVNNLTKLARQLVLSDSRYSTRHQIIAPRPPS